MALSDLFQVNKIKAELEETRKERDQLKAVMAETGQMDAVALKQAIASQQNKLDEIQRQVADAQSKADLEAAKTATIFADQKQKYDQQLADLDKQAEAKKREQMATADLEATKSAAAFASQKRYFEQQLADLDKQVQAKKNDLIVMDEEILLQSFGFYKPHYDLQNSDQYKARLSETRDKQAMMVKAGTAATCPTSWTVNNSQAEGKKLIRDYTKLIVRSFNNECDASIVNVKFSNVESIEKRIRSAFDTLNSLGARMQIALNPQYLAFKFEELHLCYEYQVKKQEEKEELRRLREEAREAAKAAKELEEQRAKLEKEQNHLQRAIGAATERLERATSQVDKDMIQQELGQLEQACAGVEKDIQNVQNREGNWRSGFVYIISNTGAFGPDIYKIGVTRRLDPQERVDELGDASVPFAFDVHALIFSEDAPALETALHKAFDLRKVNAINPRKEFFQVKLEEIEQVVRNNHNKSVEWCRLAPAEEYRRSLEMQGGSQLVPSTVTANPSQN